jgi:diguanylate cyclase (GGDEF)-like protein/PAS domain S-box-containing protein
VPLAIIGRGGDARLNAAAQRFFDAPADTALGELVAAADRERFEAWLDAARRGPCDGRAGDDTIEVQVDEDPPARQIACTALRSGDLLTVAVTDVSERERLRVTADEMFLGVATIDREGIMTWRHRRRDEPDVVEESVGQHVLTRVHPDDHEKCMAVLDSLAGAPGGRRSMVLRIRPPGVTGAWFSLRFTSVSLHHDPLVNGVLSAWQPSGAILGPDGDRTGLGWDVIEATSEGIVLFDPDVQLRYRNRRARTLLGEDVGLDGVDSLLGDVDPDHRDRVREAAESGFAGLGSQVVARTTVGGDERWVRLTAVPDTSLDGVTMGVALTIQDVTDEVRATDELRAARDELWHLAHHDRLTGLANRARLLDELAAALDGPEAGLALLSVDLDGFKQVNDEQGHLEGDAVLVEVGRALERAAGTSGLVARWGGDEFLVLVHDVDPDGDATDPVPALAAQVAAEIARATEALGSPVGASVGVARARTGDDPTSLLRRVDEAMYAEKATRRRRADDR